MSSLSSEFKGLSQTAPNFPNAIRGREKLVSGKLYCTKCVFPKDGHHEPCKDEIFTFGTDIDGQFFLGTSTYPNSLGYSYADRGIEPYKNSKGNISGWHKTHYTILMELK